MITNNRPSATETTKILIADDDEATRILLRAAITPWGYRIAEASDGEQAWDILQQKDPPKILILDWLMPKLTGIELCKRINKELKFYPYIIFLTSMTGTENVIQGLEAGADEFVMKPFEIADLRIRIFAGERIIKYRNQISEMSYQLQNYTNNMNKIAEERAKDLIPYNDLLTVLHNIQRSLDEINEDLSIHREENRDNIDKISNLQIKLNNLLNVIKSFKIENNSSTSINKLNKPALIIKEKSIIDMERLQAFFGNNSDAISNFINTFISLAKEQIANIKNAITNKDAKTAKYYFHLLGGAAGNSGISKIYAICNKAEEKTDAGDWNGLTICCNDLEIAIKELESAKNI